MWQTRWEYLLTFLFIMVNVVLLSLIVTQYYFGKNYRAQLLEELKDVKSAEFEIQDIPNYHFSKQAIIDYHNIVMKPLFFKSRHPVIASEESEASSAGAIKKVTKEIDLKLIGIINTPDTIYSLFYNEKSNSPEDKYIRFKPGDEINGRTIKEIKSDRVVISKDDKIEEIFLLNQRKDIPKKNKQSRQTNPFLKN